MNMHVGAICSQNLQQQTIRLQQCRDDEAATADSLYCSTRNRQLFLFLDQEIRHNFDTVLELLSGMLMMTSEQHPGHKAKLNLLINVNIILYADNDQTWP